MTPRAKVLMLEFNELTPWLMDQFIEAGHLPNFQKLRQHSHVLTTDTEAEGEWLNPWVQWVSVHSGLTHDEHGVFRLTQANEMQEPAVWDLLSDAGYQNWICGSMNSWYGKDFQGHLLPDFWDPDSQSFPKNEFDSFINFVQPKVQEYGNKHCQSNKMTVLNFLSFMARRGLSMKTISGVVKQLVRERFSNSAWKRASVLELFQYDLFSWYWKKHQPDFAILFANSTAHYQHKFWRNMQPEEFQIRPTNQDQRDYGNAILYGYQMMDDLVGRIMKLVDPGTTVILTSALGQQPYTRMEDQGGKRFYRITDQDVFSKLLGIHGNYQYQPIMADEFFLKFADEQTAIDCAERLKGYQLDGTPVFSTDLQGSDVIVQCTFRKFVPEDAMVHHVETGQAVAFNDVFYLVNSLKSGMHHPHGIFWVSNPLRDHRVYENMVPLTSVAPTILDIFGVTKPETMQGDSVFQSSEKPVEQLVATSV